MQFLGAPAQLRFGLAYNVREDRDDPHQEQPEAPEAPRDDVRELAGLQLLAARLVPTDPDHRPADGDERDAKVEREPRRTWVHGNDYRRPHTLLRMPDDIAPLPIDVLKVDHVAFATWDAVAHARLLTEVLGAEFFDAGDEPHNGFRWLQFKLPGGKVEIIEPLTKDGFLYRFLMKRGEGIHHVTVYVKDLAVAVEQLRAVGYQPVDVNLASPMWKEAFMSPRETNGVLLQLAQVPDPELPNPRMKSLDEYLADRPGLRPD